jgi:hypothetical protein
MHHRRPPRQHVDLIGQTKKSPEKFHLPMTELLMHVNFRSHHVRFHDDWDNQKFHYVALRDQIDALYQ